MRKLLLASAAALCCAANARAAGLIEMNPATSPPSVGDASGVVIPPTKSAWNAPDYNPDPGKVIIRIDGLVAFDAGVIGSNSDHGQAGTPNAGAKNQNLNFSGFLYLYFGVDGKLSNGIIYGANAEMRTTFAGLQPVGFAGTGAVGNASANSMASLWFTRRAYGYVGSPNYGLIRFGQGDGPLSIFTIPGLTTGEAFDATGAWDGDGPDFLGNGALNWAFNDVGNEYASNKIVYLSPNIAGFVVGASFAPSSSVLAINQCANAASGACIGQSSSTLATDLARPRNTAEIATRWQGTVGPVTVDYILGYQKSAVVNNASVTNPGVKFKGVDAIDSGASLTWHGASVFGHIYEGTMNGTVTPQPVIKGRSKHGLAWTAGAQYSIGAWTAGASYYAFESEGAVSGTGNRVERGIAVGGYYEAAPGFDIAVQYLYGTRFQRGVNFIDSTGPTTAGNRIQSEGVVTSMLLRW